MAGGEKPYRVYRGGRAKGKVPTVPRPDRPRKDGKPDRAYVPVEPGRRWPRRLFVGTALLLAFLAVWGLASFLAFRGGVADANKRLGATTRATLDPRDGLLFSKPSNILLLGTDSANTAAREGLRHSDSIMLVRTDPSKNRVAYLSIPRDLYVEIPGHGRQKVNAAYQIGGAPLTIRTVRGLTGLPIHHIAVVQFEQFRELIDALGGIDVNVPRPIVANRFDCPYATQAQCQEWPGWRFGKGSQHMNGQRALVYARIRENRLDPGENDLSRGERQQQVLQSLTGKLTSPLTLAKLPFVGGELLSPLASDLGAWEFVQLGWLKFRSSGDLRCRLGGSDAYAGGQRVIEPEAEDNFETLTMFMGRSAPQPPPPGQTFAPGCVTG